MGKGKAIMLQGTASDVGKTVLCTALCRIFKQDGLRVAPFKAQNMTNNVYLTAAGWEMGIAQALQAEAAGVTPRVEMNPIILKPTGEATAQVIVLGKPLAAMSAKDYRRDYLPRARQLVRDCLIKLRGEYELLVIEGAGSAAEVNLKDGDIVNMATAEMANSPVVLVADIDRGGVFASITGTLELLSPPERERVVGLIINKFRGDLDLFQSGIEFLEERTGKPVLGVIPYLAHHLPAEDSASLDYRQNTSKEIEIAVLQLPRIANFAELALLGGLPGVTLRYFKDGRPLLRPMGRIPAAVILPDTNNPKDDEAFLKAKGYPKELATLADIGVPILGLGAGRHLLDKFLREEKGEAKEIGLGTEGSSLLSNQTRLLTWLNDVRRRQGLTALTGEVLGEGDRERDFDQLAAHVRGHLNLPLLYRLLDLSVGKATC